MATKKGTVLGGPQRHRLTGRQGKSANDAAITGE